MFWFLSLQAMANDGQVNNGKGNAGGGTGYTGNAGIASSKDQEVSKAIKCIDESQAKDKTAWPRKFMELRQKWISTELACAPAQKMSKPGYACIGGTPDASGNVPCEKKVDVPATPYYGSNGQYEAFLRTHHDLIQKAQSLATQSEAAEAESAGKYRSEITRANCSSKLPEYYRAMTYTTDEVKWHIAYELKKEGKCSDGPSSPPIILEERSEKIRVATAGFTKNAGFVKTASSSAPGSVTPASAAGSAPTLLASSASCSNPDYEQVANKYLNTKAWMYGFARRCETSAGVAQAYSNFVAIENQLNASLESTYKSYMASQNRSSTNVFDNRTDIWNKHANQGLSQVNCAGPERATFNQIASLSAQDYLGRLKSGACNADSRQASNVQPSQLTN